MPPAPDDIEKLAELVKRAGRAAADAKRDAKRATDAAEALAVRVAALEARLTASETGRLTHLLGAVRGLSTPAQVLIALAILAPAFAFSGLIFPGITQAISAIGAIYATVAPPAAPAAP